MTTLPQMQAQNFSHAEAVTPSDSTAVAFDALYIGGAGAVAVVLADDSVAVTFAAVPAGTLLRVRAIKVMSTNTTATLILGLRA